MGVFFTLALATGARRGELCALSWSDLDFEARTVTIARSLCQIKDRIELKRTKTGSVRRLSLSRLAFDALRRQHAAQAHDELRARGRYLDEGAVFAIPLGGRATPMTATKAYVGLAKAARISTTRMHDTRHTAATHLLVGGAEVRNARKNRRTLVEARRLELLTLTLPA
jgi:integrase